MGKQITIKHIQDEGEGTIVEISGKLYKRKSVRGAVETFEEFDQPTYNKEIKELATKLIKLSDLDLVAVMENALKGYDAKDLERIKHNLESEIAKAKEEDREPEIKKEKGCIGLRIGNTGRTGTFIQVA